MDIGGPDGNNATPRPMQARLKAVCSCCRPEADRAIVCKGRPHKAKSAFARTTTRFTTHTHTHTHTPGAALRQTGRFLAAVLELLLSRRVLLVLHRGLVLVAWIRFSARVSPQEPRTMAYCFQSTCGPCRQLRRCVCLGDAPSRCGCPCWPGCRSHPCCARRVQSSTGPCFQRGAAGLDGDPNHLDALGCQSRSRFACHALAP